MTMSTEENILQFSPFISLVDPSFWHKVTQIKLDVDRLNENVHSVWGYFSNKAPQGLNKTLSVDCSSFNNKPDMSQIFCHGRIINKNTIESFKEEDKAQILSNEGKALMKLIKSEAIENPSCLTRFLIFTFADLKKYHFYYWFAFPVPSFLTCTTLATPVNIGSLLSKPEITSLYNGYIDLKEKNFFLVIIEADKIEVLSLKDGMSRIRGSDNWLLGFADPSSETLYPGWPLRNLLAFMCYHCPELMKASIQVLSLRLHLFDGSWSAEESVVFNILVNVKNNAWEEASSGLHWVGWERNERGKMGPRFANLSSSMDPVRLAETAVDLNLKLMKWQLMPELNLDVVKDTRCLLLGAGTLGCAVARNLMSWGVRHITFLDNGRVSYSNPVRQSLYKFADCARGGVAKAEAAAAALKEIFPGITCEGVVLSIPMPGHPVGESLMLETKTAVEQLEHLIESHDVVFLLMDSRESRWLPTLLSSAKSKLAINAALGFDSYLVMRHGVKQAESQSGTAHALQRNYKLAGSQLGCYFCNDVTAPGDTSSVRTLDQQCTVTRPGVSNIAGALAVELMVSILQHPLLGDAPAESDSDETHPTSCLGIIPHSVRGFISHYQTVLPATEAFSSCVACSPKVIHEYMTSGFDFILKVIDCKTYLEELTGLTLLHNEAVLSEIIEYSASDSDSAG